MAAVLLDDLAKTATLGAATADTVTVTPESPVEITNLDATNIIWVRHDGQAATAGGVNCVPVGPGRTLMIPASTGSVSLFPDANTPKYTISKSRTGTLPRA